MPRKKCFRRCRFLNEEKIFKPIALPMRELEVIEVSIDEFEALRLSDLEGFSQIEGAEKMSISRSTFQRLLEQGRRKIIDAILNNKAIKISNNINNYSINIVGSDDILYSNDIQKR